MITSSSNQQMKNITALMKKAKERKSQNLFVVEGRKMFEEVPSEWLSKVYVSERFLEEPEAEQLLAGKIYEVVADAVFKSISDTQTPQGILCLVRMPQYPLSDLLRGDRTHLLIVESIQDPGNLGTIFRTAEAAGATGILLSSDSVDVYNPKVIRSTMGAVFRMPFFYVKDLPAAVKSLSSQGIRTYAAHLNGKNVYDEEDYTEGCAFLIGNEGNGLRDEVSECADCLIRIPMCGKAESLNAAVAAAVLMFEAGRQRRK